MKNEDTRNTIIFFVCAALLLVLYQVFVIDPAGKRRQEELARQAPATAATNGIVIPAAPQVPQALTRQAAVQASPRVAINTPSLKGSLSLVGARIDDLYLTQYRQTVDRDAPPVELLRPEGAQHAWFADIGWVGANVPGLPNVQTLWNQAGGETLAPGKPVSLIYANGRGLTFIRDISVDDKFMFTIRDTVHNATDLPVTVAPYGSVQRQGLPTTLGRNQIVHEGAVGWLDERLRLVKYNKWAKGAGGPSYTATNGWMGITDKYWLAALIPDQGEEITGQFRLTQTGTDSVFDANFVGQSRTINVGEQISETTHFFAGAKQVPLLRAYEDDLGIAHFYDAVDWGNFWFLTRPIFAFLEFIQSRVGTFGVAILLLTVVVRLVFFPLANKQYESMTKMKKMQPQVEALRKRFKEDKAKLQQETLALYQREKMNPLAGCLPVLLQIPVFYALYKVLSVTLEMRHAPFMGWIQDLSARDPTTLWNLFGLIPWNPASAPLIGGFLDGPLHLGVLALFYGFTMWLSMSMNPPVGDPVQQKIFQYMPLIFTFIMAGFAVGLLIYWTWSNVLTLLQQYVIMRRFGVDNPIDQLIRRFSGKPQTPG